KLPAVGPRHDHVEQHEVGLLLLDDRERLLRALGLADRVAGRLEVDANELAHPRVVVDDEYDRACVLPARARAPDERLEVAAPVASVAARRVERRHAAEIRPLADRGLRDAEVLRRLAERHPVLLGSVGAPVRTARIGAHTRIKLPKVAQNDTDYRPRVFVPPAVVAGIGSSGTGLSVR